jgi:NAD(P)H-dependent flavin oxidoreductase YrpB (nitropropane dioxygenase family)
MQFAWERPDQDLAPYFGRAHDAGCKVTYMAGTVPEAVRAAKAGADVIVAQGILLGTRFLATDESPPHPNVKQSIVDSDGHDTQLSEIPDLAAGLVWPGAMTRSRRNKFIERWAGREWYLRQNRAEAHARLQAARKNGEVDEGPLSMGQDAGLIHDIVPAGDIVTRIAQEADEILRKRLPRFVA